MQDDPAPGSLFGDVVQPDSLSLFSSTSSDPLVLWALHRDALLEEDSGIRLLIDATDQIASTDPRDTSPAFKLRVEPAARGTCNEAVLHIQSPAIRDTFICSPPTHGPHLGIKLPYLTIQFRPIGHFRPFLFEVGITDRAGRRGIVRVSSFQTRPKLHLLHSSNKSAGTSNRTLRDSSPMLLHLPLAMAPQPEQDDATLTAWQVLTLPLDRIARSMSDKTLLSASQDGPAISGLDRFGEFNTISYIKIHANARLRRVWCSRTLPDHDLAEFQIFC